MPTIKERPDRPKGILLDLDDTLIDAYRDPDAAWRAVIAEMLPRLGTEEIEALTGAVMGEIRLFLADPEKRRTWRLDPRSVRPPILSRALETLADAAAHGATAADLAARYERYRRERMALRASTIQLLTQLRDREIRLALITNGRSDVQRHKIARFGLAPFFDHIQIEEEAGYGKPDRRAFLDCLDALGLAAEEAWMAGDDIYYDIVPANALGLRTFWYREAAPGPAADEPSERHHRIEALETILDFLDEGTRSD